MKKIKSLFGGISLTWGRTVLAAVLLGIYTGVVAAIPALKDTSFQDISISFEWWVLFGILIIMNSSSNLDSALKCFVFFLISQPLVYLVQVPFSPLGFQLFMFYKPWFIWTLFTFPMGWIGYYMKKSSPLALLILSPMLLFVGGHLYEFTQESISFFPHHLLSAVFCAVTIFLYVSAIVPEKREKTIGYTLCAVILAACLLIGTVTGLKKTRTYNTTLRCSSEELFFDETYSVSLEDDSLGTVYIGTLDLGDEAVGTIFAEFRKTGTTRLILENGEHRYEFELTVGINTYTLTQEPTE